jgi:hypothetical protein
MSKIADLVDWSPWRAGGPSFIPGWLPTAALRWSQCSVWYPGQDSLVKVEKTEVVAWESRHLPLRAVRPI